MPLWLLTKLVDRDLLALLGLVLGLQLVGIDLIGPAVDFAVSLVPAPDLGWFVPW